MVTNTPIGVFAAIVILPSCLDIAVVHRRLTQISTAWTTGRIEPCDRSMCGSELPITRK